jgi:hypothetical protein
MYITISAVVSDPEKNRVEVFLDHGVLRKSLGYVLSKLDERGLI